MVEITDINKDGQSVSTSCHWSQLSIIAFHTSFIGLKNKIKTLNTYWWGLTKMTETSLALIHFVFCFLWVFCLTHILSDYIKAEGFMTYTAVDQADLDSFECFRHKDTVWIHSLSSIRQTKSGVKIRSYRKMEALMFICFNKLRIIDLEVFETLLRMMPDGLHFVSTSQGNIYKSQMFMTDYIICFSSRVHPPWLQQTNVFTPKASQIQCITNWWMYSVKTQLHDDISLLWVHSQPNTSLYSSLCFYTILISHHALWQRAMTMLQ